MTEGFVLALFAEPSHRAEGILNALHPSVRDAVRSLWENLRAASPEERRTALAQMAARTALGDATEPSGASPEARLVLRRMHELLARDSTQEAETQREELRRLQWPA